MSFSIFKTTKRFLISLFFLCLLSCNNSIKPVVDSHQQTLTKQTRRYSLPTKMQEKLLKEMIWVESGSFEMGSNSKAARKREKPAHQVTLDGFYIGQSEVTQALFEQIMGWNYSYFQCATCPVNNISWFQIQLFIKSGKGWFLSSPPHTAMAFTLGTFYISMA